MPPQDRWKSGGSKTQSHWEVILPIPPYAHPAQYIHIPPYHQVTPYPAPTSNRPPCSVTMAGAATEVGGGGGGGTGAATGAAAAQTTATTTKKTRTAHELAHPHGTTLLSRDTPENRERWGPGGIGYVDVSPEVCPSGGPCPHYRHTSDAVRAGTDAGGEGRRREGADLTPIHLLIASYRDRLCPRTLHNAFSRAENPARLYVRVIEQTQPGSDLLDDAGCWERYCQDYNPGCAVYAAQVRTVPMDASGSRGPTDARSRLSSMVEWDYVHGRDGGDPDLVDLVPVGLHDFCLQIDSHMDFSDDYDTELILMHHRTRNDYAVLSTYVADMEQNNQGVRIVPNLCMVTFTRTIRNWGTKECRNLTRPKLTNAMWGAGLSFHRCHAELNVPVDPYLDGVFDGEEGSRGLRFFTHGYDVYTPDVVLVTHDYHTHQSNPVVHTWGHGKAGERGGGGGGGGGGAGRGAEVETFRVDVERERPRVRTRGTPRVNMLLGIGRPLPGAEDVTEVGQIRRSRFGLGDRRTLLQAEEFSGIDLAAKEMVKNRCGNLLWVPYEESPGGNYGVAANLNRPLVGPEGGGGTVRAGASVPSSASAAATGVQGADPAPVITRRGDGTAAAERSASDAAGAVVSPVAIRGSLPQRAMAANAASGYGPFPMLAAIGVAVSLLAYVGNMRRTKKGAKHKN